MYQFLLLYGSLLSGLIVDTVSRLQSIIVVVFAARLLSYFVVFWTLQYPSRQQIFRIEESTTTFVGASSELLQSLHIAESKI